MKPGKQSSKWLPILSWNTQEAIVFIYPFTAHTQTHTHTHVHKHPYNLCTGTAQKSRVVKNDFGSNNHLLHQQVVGILF